MTSRSGVIGFPQSGSLRDLSTGLCPASRGNPVIFQKRRERSARCWARGLAGGRGTSFFGVRWQDTRSACRLTRAGLAPPPAPPPPPRVAAGSRDIRLGVAAALLPAMRCRVRRMRLPREAQGRLQPRTAREPIMKIRRTLHIKWASPPSAASDRGLRQPRTTSYFRSSISLGDSPRRKTRQARQNTATRDSRFSGKYRQGRR